MVKGMPTECQLAPERSQTVLGPGPAALSKTRDECRSVEGPGARTADALDFNVWLIQ